MEKLFCDCKTDAEKSAFFLSGRAVETGVIAAAISNDVAMAYHRCDEFKKENDALRAKIAEMEKQFPICRIKDIRRAHYLTKVVGLDPEAWLYALPGAQPQLNEIKIALKRALELGQRETWTGARKHRSWEAQREEQQCWNKVWSLLGAQGEEK